MIAGAGKLLGGQIQTNLNKLKLCGNGIFMLSTTKALDCMLLWAAAHTAQHFLLFDLSNVIAFT